VELKNKKIGIYYAVVVALESFELPKYFGAAIGNQAP
jgi:hypothetical protein